MKRCRISLTSHVAVQAQLSSQFAASLFISHLPLQHLADFPRPPPPTTVPSLVAMLPSLITHALSLSLSLLSFLPSASALPQITRTGKYLYDPSGNRFTLKVSVGLCR